MSDTSSSVVPVFDGHNDVLARLLARQPRGQPQKLRPSGTGGSKARKPDPPRSSGGGGYHGGGSGVHTSVGGGHHGGGGGHF